MYSLHYNHNLIHYVISLIILLHTYATNNVVLSNSTPSPSGISSINSIGSYNGNNNNGDLNGSFNGIIIEIYTVKDDSVCCCCNTCGSNNQDNTGNGNNNTNNNNNSTPTTPYGAPPIVTLTTTVTVTDINTNSNTNTDTNIVTVRVTESPITTQDYSTPCPIESITTTSSSPLIVPSESTSLSGLLTGSQITSVININNNINSSLIDINNLSICNVIDPTRIELPWHNSSSAYPQVYDANKYVCVDNNFLCPISAPLRCQYACYTSTQYTCNNNTLQQTIIQTNSTTQLQLIN